MVVGECIEDSILVAVLLYLHLQQAKAFGNLGNTFKALKNYPNAIKCCEAHLEITKELHDRLGNHVVVCMRA